MFSAPFRRQSYPVDKLVPVNYRRRVERDPAGSEVTTFEINHFSFGTPYLQCGFPIQRAEIVTNAVATAKQEHQEIHARSPERHAADTLREEEEKWSKARRRARGVTAAYAGDLGPEHDLSVVDLDGDVIHMDLGDDALNCCSSQSPTASPATSDDDTILRWME